MRRKVMGPWPLRARLTAAFVVVMAVVLTLGGGFLYVRLGNSLDSAVTLGLRSRADDLRDRTSAEAGTLAEGSSALTERGESIAQRLDVAGEVLDATPGLRGRSLLSGRQLSAALAGREVLFDRSRTPAGDDPVRLLAVSAPGGVLVVGASTEESREALTDTGELLLLGGPFVLLLTGLAGYLLAGAALRPV